MRNAKKYWMLVTAIVMMIVLALLVVACDSDSSGNNQDQKQKVEMGLTYGFQSEDDSSIDPNLKKFNVGEIYYMVINFSIATVEESDTTNKIDFKITFENLDALEGRIVDADTGRVTDMSFLSSEGTQAKETTVTFTVPREAEKTVEKDITIRLMPKKQADTLIKGVFEGENVEILGDGDGFTKNIASTKVQIKTPQLSYDPTTGMLHWYHVKHADYYQLVVDGVVIEHPIPPDNREEGSELIFVLSEIGFTQGQIQIVAYSNNSKDYPESNRSNAVPVKL